MKKSKKAQILLPPVALAAVLSMSGIASASQTEYVQTKVPSTNAAVLAPSYAADNDDNGNGMNDNGDENSMNDNGMNDNGDDNGDDDNGNGNGDGDGDNGNDNGGDNGNGNGNGNNGNGNGNGDNGDNGDD
jgi:hypothetical protein